MAKSQFQIIFRLLMISLICYVHSKSSESNQVDVEVERLQRSYKTIIDDLKVAATNCDGYLCQMVFDKIKVSFFCFHLSVIFAYKT